MQYSSQVIELFDEAYGALMSEDVAAAAVGTAGERAQGCRIRFYLVAENGLIKRLRYQAYACPSIIAACSRVVKDLEGGELSAIGTLEPADLMALLEIPTEKAGKMLILQDALQESCRAAKAAD